MSVCHFYITCKKYRKFNRQPWFTESRERPLIYPIRKMNKWNINLYLSNPDQIIYQPITLPQKIPQHNNQIISPDKQTNYSKTEHLTWGILAVKNQLIPWVPSPSIVSKNRDVTHCTEATSTLNLPHASLCPLTAGKRYPTERGTRAL